jgi:NAD(P)-dependent dehydrogenase (short-subunit alcohol dehydrogenase family)
MKFRPNQTIFITGATDGLGKLLAERLAAGDHRVILHGRNPEKGQAVLEEISRKTGNTSLDYVNGDLSTLAGVRELASALLLKYPHPDVLINNAGLGSGAENKRQLSPDGFEMRFAINYLAPFLLTHLLLPAFHHDQETQILNVASRSQHPLDFSNLMLEQDYDGRRAYSQSKLALIMFTYTLAGQSKDSRLRVNAVHPEGLMNTPMVLNKYGYSESTVEDGAENVLHVLTSDETQALTGTYFFKKEVSKAHEQAYDILVRDQLYRLSRELTGL